MSNSTPTANAGTGPGERPQVELFTEAEHVVLGDWLHQEPRCETDLSVEDALETLGIPAELDHVVFDSSDAGVAAAVLRNAHARLPQFAAVDLQTPASLPLIERVKLGREIRPDPAQRQVKLFPQHLFTINWAFSGPGFSWPEAYYATWVPGYEVAIVTASSDSSDAYGGCTDLAIGAAEASDDLAKAGLDSAAWVWQELLGEGDQQRWAIVEEEGIVSRAQAEAMADDVWGPRR